MAQEVSILTLFAVMILWLDDHHPPDFEPLVGTFQDGIGEFFHDSPGRRLRFLWENITDVSARWSQSISTDGGETWKTNFIMDFHREPKAPSGASR
jgi:hypothetical protein